MKVRKSLHRDSDTGKAVSWLRGAVVVMTALFPFILWPGIERPFSTPKIVLLGGFVVIAGILAMSTGHYRLPFLPRGFRLSMIAWPSALIVSALLGAFVSQEALWLSLFSLGWFLLVMLVRPRPVHVAMAVAAAGTITAAIACLQYLALDPFRLVGWTTPVYGSPRMRVFATLGNPNFVAAVLVAGIPLSIYLGKLLKPRFLYYAAAALQSGAILATGSRAAMAALIAALIWLGALGQWTRWRLVAAALVVIAVLPLMPSRSLMNTFEGRFYIWRVAVPHLFERPLFGFGPGAFEPKFIEWETAHWRDGKGTADQRKFTGLQAHAHNDFLEIIVDSGFVAVLSLWFLLGSFFTFAFLMARKASDGLVIGASAGVVALVTVAMFDFPFHRPTELFLFWTLMTIVYLQFVKISSAPFLEKRGAVGLTQ